MRRSGMPALFAALALSLAAAPAAAQGDESEIYASQDGPISLFTVEVPGGAAPPGTTVGVARRDPGERPEELSEQPMPNPFYELLPVDVRFSEPVTVTRRIEFSQLGIDSFDPTQHGLVVGSLFTRDAEGVWSWLDGAEVRVDAANHVFVVTGRMDHGGPVIGLIGANLVIAPTDPPESAVGEVFQVEGLLRSQPVSNADIAAVSGGTSEPMIAALLRSYDVEVFERAAGLEFECLAPGTVTYEVTFTIADVADASPLNEPIGLGGTDVDLTYTGEHSCLE